MRGYKRIVALLQVLIVAATSINVSDFGGNNVVEAAETSIVSGKSYSIVSAYNGRAITQTDVSNYYANCVVWNTDAMSDLARWRIDESGDYYTITNVVTGKSMKTTGNNSGDTLDFNGNDGADRYKWKLEPITSGQYAGGYFLISAVKNDNGEDEYAEIIADDDKRDLDGAQVRLWTKVTSIAYEPRQVWYIRESEPEYTGLTEEMTDLMVQAWKQKYYIRNSATGYMAPVSDDPFWGMAEVMEFMLDGYETTGKAVYREMFETTFDDFMAVNGEDWAWKDWNDDIAWAAIAAARGYLLFGTEKYLKYGKANFDMMFERANNRSDGMLIWKMNHDNDDTTSCINGPAIVAACYLAKATGDDSYYTKAKNLYSAWRNSTMYEDEGDEVGHVWDTMWEYWCSTYNQGTFIGAALMLYERYGDESYYKDACDAVSHAMKALCYNNILIKEDANTVDNSKMRGILMRYLRKFIVEYNNEEYLNFFKTNVKYAWMNKNSDNLVHNTWNKKAGENGNWHSYTTYNALSLMVNMPSYTDTIIKNPYSIIEAENLDYCRKLISENSTGTSGGRSLGGIKNDCYSAYYNVDFGDNGASSVTFRYSRTPEKENAKGRIDIRLGSQTGPSIGTAYLDNTTGWGDWKEVTAEIQNVKGLQNIYLVYSTDSEHVCNLDYMVFEEAVELKDAFQTIEAESYDAAEGIALDGIGVSDIHTNDWIRYDNVYFSKIARSFSLKYTMQNSDYSGKIKIYVDSTESEPIGEIHLEDTNVNTTYVVNKFNLDTYIQEGTYSVYLKFVADDGKSKVADIDYFSFSDFESVIYSDDIKVEGYQLNTTFGGTRTIGSVEPSINDTKVEKWGFVYALAEANGVNNNISDGDMMVGKEGEYVVSYESTPEGTASEPFGDSKTATYFVRTMTFGGNSTNAYTATYKVRAYAVLEDGTYVYSDIGSYNIYRIANILYQNVMMNTEEKHDYLYEKILTVVDETYKKVSYDWDNIIVGAY